MKCQTKLNHNQESLEDIVGQPLYYLHKSFQMYPLIYVYDR